MGYVQCPNGLVLPQAAAEARYSRRMPTGVDFFCGAGGASLGMIEAGVEIVAAIEWDEIAARTYMRNLCRYGEFTLHFVEDRDRERIEQALREAERAKGVGIIQPSTAGSGWIASQPRTVPGCRNFIFGDVRRLTAARLLKMIGMERGEIDCVFGSPPCQGFSRANGTRSVLDPRNDLVFVWARLVLEIAPKTIAMENVPGMLDMETPDGIPVIDALARVLEDGDFAGLNAVRRAVAAQTGAVAVLRKAERSEARRRPVEDATQADLFGEVVA